MLEMNSPLSMKQQIELLRYSSESFIALSEVLSDNGFSYDDLRYKEYPFGIPINTEYISLDEIEPASDDIPAISFFSGAGGLDIGFEYAGFNNLAAIEFTDVFCKTLRKNHPQKTVIGPPGYSGDISSHEEIAGLLSDIIGIKQGFDGVFHGGPPCQSFSVAANQRFSKGDENFKRRGFDDPEKGSLLFHYLWLIRYFLPRAFIIENVAGIQECDNDNRIRQSLRELSTLGYNITVPTVVNTAQYGIPQNRFRWIVIGIRDSACIELPHPKTTVTPCYNVFERPIGNARNHQTRNHTADSILRYMVLQYGGRDKLGRVDRLNPYVPSKTVIAGGLKGGGRSHLHPYFPRTLSVRECARIQTFPDSYEFEGSTARQFTQVGNAVPPLFAYQLAVAVKRALSAHPRILPMRISEGPRTMPRTRR
jgi:DNA (cytosine-5)-methyltransferase 1